MYFNDIWLLQEEDATTEAPWQKELKSRKKKEPVKLPVAKPLPPPTEVEKKPAPPPAAKIGEWSDYVFTL